jgi:prolyl 4-hydroxylase
MKDYMNSEVLVEDRYQEIRYDCLNEEPECVEWAALGECAINKKWMTTNCAPACRTCHLLIYEERCPWKPSNETNIWKQPGDLSRMFKKIITSPQYQKYQVQVLSKPPEGPYVVALDGFLSLEEAQRLIELGGQRGYLQSMDVGEKRPDGTFEDYQNPLRTSTNAWCLEECHEDEATRTILARIEELTGVPDDYSEYLQLLKYEVGQKYGKHHDYIPHLVDRPEGVRIATVFIYLNDVEGGGGTNFPILNLTVFPKRGRVLIWPSVLDDDPNEKDERTEHQALPVEAGVKYGANAWLHNRDFKDSFSRGCS